MSEKTNTESFRERLAAGNVVVGTFLKTPTGHATEIFGDLGYDFVVIDSEHAPFDRGDIDAVLLAGRAANIPGIVRVPSSDKAHILSALDCGAAGILVPHVKTAEMAADIVAKSRFRGGKRGFSPSGRAGKYGGVGLWDYVDECDALTTVIGMIEDPEAIDNIEEIVAVEGLDAVFIGRGDLTIAYGVPNPGAPEVMDAIKKVTAAAKAAGKAVLTISPGGEDSKWLLSLGITGFIMASDQGFMRQAAAKCLADLKSIQE